MTNPRPLRVAISTCPNDTFAFHAILERRIDTEGLELEIELADVEELNRRLAAGELDVAKGSFALALEQAGELCVLDAGSALGFGVGPVLIAGSGGASTVDDPSVLCPGAHTTATLLYTLLHPGVGRLEQTVFSNILPALERGDADLGVCIHEGRFTYAERGLQLVEDLGVTWEQRTGAPLPLGGILARRSLPPELLEQVTALIRRSIDWGIAHADETLPTMRRYADEHSDEVLRAHVDLYVNAWTRSLGREGRDALETLDRLAREAGHLSSDHPHLEVVGGPDPASSARSAERLFHLIPTELWSTETGPLVPTPSLATEGFVHLSSAGQLAGTLAVHFSGETPLCLLEVDSRAVADRVVFEPSRGGMLFPHLYRPLLRTEVLQTWELTRSSNAWSLPDLAAPL